MPGISLQQTNSIEYVMEFLQLGNYAWAVHRLESGGQGVVSDDDAVKQAYMKRARKAISKENAK